MFCCAALEDNVPGGVYLCQVSESVSCGACCGLYNVQDARLESLEDMLALRTEKFRGVPRDVDGILAFKEAIESKESQKRPFPRFHHCPYMGLIGERGFRVGCLLHPLAHGNNGVDLRGISFYGGMACRVYFCPSYHHLLPEWKEIVAQTAPHWHLYGLVVTETEMLANFFRRIEHGLKRPLLVEDVCENDKAVEILWDFFALKLDWPFRDQAVSVWGNYFFHDDRYHHPFIDYDRLGVPPSEYDAILKALRSDFKNLQELEVAESLLDDIFKKLVFSISSQYPGVSGGHFSETAFQKHSL